MCTIQFTALFGLTVLGAIGAEFILPAGKCRTFDIYPIPVDLDSLAAIGKWKITDATNTYSDIDHEYRDAYTLGQNMYHLHDTRTYNNGTKSQYTFLVECIDNVIYEDCIDENGNRKRFYIYPLGYVEGALLYYRCSDSGRTDIDTRIIEVPRNLTLSDAGRTQLLDIDKSYNFNGDLKELRYNIPE